MGGQMFGRPAVKQIVEPRSATPEEGDSVEVEQSYRSGMLRAMWTCVGLVMILIVCARFFLISNFYNRFLDAWTTAGAGWN